MSDDVLVVGAGLGGLAAAMAAPEAGCVCSHLEDDRVYHELCELRQRVGNGRGDGLLVGGGKVDAAELNHRGHPLRPRRQGRGRLPVALVNVVCVIDL